MIRYSILFLSVVSATGCATATAPCTFEVDPAEWSAVAPIPGVRPADTEEPGIKWYRNASGDYLICLSPKGGNVCGGNYESYGLLPDGTFERDIIICTS